MISTLAAQADIPTSKNKIHSFPTVSSAWAVVCFSDQVEMESQNGFDLYFPN